MNEWIKNNAPVLCLKTIFGHWNCFLASIVTDGKDEHGLTLEIGGQRFQSFNALLSPQNSSKLWYY